MNPEDFRVRKDWYFPYNQDDLVRLGYRSSSLEDKRVARCTNLKCDLEKKDIK